MRAVGRARACLVWSLVFTYLYGVHIWHYLWYYLVSCISRVYLKCGFNMTSGRSLMSEFSDIGDPRSYHRLKKAKPVGRNTLFPSTPLGSPMTSHLGTPFEVVRGVVEKLRPGAHFVEGLRNIDHARTDGPALATFTVLQSALRAVIP